MLGRFGVIPPTYRHAQAEQIPLVSGIETVMAWMDMLAVRHGWQPEDILDSGGFKWYRYTGGTEEKERFTPRLTAPFELDGYPYNVSGFWEQFKAAETFIGNKLGQDWRENRWTNTYNSYPKWEEDNVINGNPAGTTDGRMPLFESGLKFGKWMSQGFNSPVYDGEPNYPDVSNLQCVATRLNFSQTEIPWTITNEGPVLVSEGDSISLYPGYSPLPVGVSGWVQTYSYASSGQPTEGTVVYLQDLVSGASTANPGRGVLDVPVFKNWTVQSNSVSSKTAAKNAFVEIATDIDSSGYLARCEPEPQSFPGEAAGTPLFPYQWLSTPPPDDDYPDFRNGIVRARTYLQEMFNWTIFDLRTTIGANSSGYSSIEGFFNSGTQYYNLKQLYGLQSVSGYPVAFDQAWQDNLPITVNGHGALVGYGGPQLVGDQNGWSQGPVSISQTNAYISTDIALSSVVINESSNYGFAYKLIPDRRVLTSGLVGGQWKFSTVVPIDASDSTIYPSSYYYNEFTDFETYSIPKIDDDPTIKTSYGLAGGSGLIINVDSFADFMDHVHNLGSGQYEAIALLHYNKDPWEDIKGLPKSGHVTNAPFVMTSRNISYVWSGNRPADGPPAFCQPGAFSPVYNYPIQRSARKVSHSLLPSVRGTPVIWPVIDSIPAPGGAGSNYLEKNNLNQDSVKIESYIPEFYDFLLKEYAFDFGDKYYYSFGGASNRSSQTRIITQNGSIVYAGGNTDWPILGVFQDYRAGILVGVDPAVPTQPDPPLDISRSGINYPEGQEFPFFE